MTRPKPLGRPVRCAKCGAKFTRTHGRQKLCASCRPAWVRARSAARAATKPARLAVNRLARDADRRWQHPAWQVMLAARCPHGDKLGDCTELWCASRREDWERHDYPPPGGPEGNDLLREEER
jgi:hypothetical protein